MSGWLLAGLLALPVIGVAGTVAHLLWRLWQGKRAGPAEKPSSEYPGSAMKNKR